MSWKSILLLGAIGCGAYAAGYLNGSTSGHWGLIPTFISGGAIGWCYELLKEK